jgi:hypothetical protein
MIKNGTGRFVEDGHTYYMTVGGCESVVPSVTQVMGEILGQPYRATEWHMQRGRAVHACAAMIALNQPFENDPQIDGQVAACRKFLKETDCQILEVEKVYYSTRYLFAGTIDLCCIVPSLGTYSLLLDYKATLTKQTEVQLGAYSLLTGVRRGVGVQLNPDGTFKTSEIYDLRRPAQEFLSLLSAYNTKARLGMLSKGEGEEDGI